jgi:Protein of unknown function (DUF3455)
MQTALKNCIAPKHHARRPILPILSATALAMAFTVPLSQPAYAAGQVTPPDVPFNLRAPDGNKAFLKGEAQGTQNYVCAPSAASPTGVAYVLFTPEATLFSEDDGGQIITHFFSPNPDPRDPNTNPAVLAPGGAIRATWVHSQDGSSVWAKLHTNGAAVPDQNAIAWLLLDEVGVEDGPTGGDILAKTTFVQRVNTTGGLAPKSGCGSPGDLGNQAFIPYTADYFFYTKD